ncbi:protoheme IX farnesyltransferase, partial [Dissoconium aciculare CBS 342.82]|uniref:Protoheme IX farnesyltransferase, mitochondrial n=1 Tax=Dissoconium aciculare CBS 342.82 TaxID=1314786 RepID=A0A6J3MHX5_9PEZI
EEAPHRRRKRLKDEAAAAANMTAAGTESSGGEKQLPPDASSTLSQDAAAAPAKSFRRVFSSYLALTKPRLAFLIVLTTTASYSIYPVPALLSTTVTSAPSLSTLTLLFLTTGTFLAIASANTLNMLFEPQHDAKMSRTRNRPLVRGLVSSRAALIFAAATGAAGTVLLWYGVNPTTALLGATNIALYAFAYTPLKRIHPVNTWVGAIVGAIPPLMGWCAAGSQYVTSVPQANSSDGGFLSSLVAESSELLFTPAATGGWLLAALLFAWQFPHFFALSHAVRHEYAGAGYRMLTSTNIPMAARVSLRYSIAMFPICAALSWTGVTDPAFAMLSAGANGWMAKEAWRFWRLNGEKGSARALFWASVWQLPIVLVLAMVLKKGLLGRVWSGIFGEEDILPEEWDDEE